MQVHQDMTLHPAMVAIVFIIFAILALIVMVKKIKQRQMGLAGFMFISTAFLVLGAIIASRVSPA